MKIFINNGTMGEKEREVKSTFGILEKTDDYRILTHMAPHSSTLAWRIPWTGEPGGLPSMGVHKVRHD